MTDKRIHVISIQCAIEFETSLSPHEYPISDGGLMNELNNAVRQVLADRYSKGIINKPHVVIPFSIEEQPV